MFSLFRVSHKRLRLAKAKEAIQVLLDTTNHHNVKLVKII